MGVHAVQLVCAAATSPQPASVLMVVDGMHTTVHTATTLVKSEQSKWDLGWQTTT